MFAVLGSVEGQSVLDLYAGSGALGIEALSRGAERAVFVENDRRALVCIRQNIERLGIAERAIVVPVGAEAAAPVLAPKAPFDLVLCDPPWAALERAARAVSALVPLLREGARVLIEHPAGEVPSVPGLVVVDVRHWGDTGATFLERVADPVAGK